MKTCLNLNKNHKLHLTQATTVEAWHTWNPFSASHVMHRNTIIIWAQYTQTERLVPDCTNGKQDISQKTTK